MILYIRVRRWPFVYASLQNEGTRGDLKDNEVVLEDCWHACDTFHDGNHVHSSLSFICDWSEKTDHLLLISHTEILIPL